MRNAGRPPAGGFLQASLMHFYSGAPMHFVSGVDRSWGFADEAVACQEKAVSLAPDNAEAHWNLANALLVAGQLERGLAEYEWRFKRPGRAERPAALALNIPRWKGEALRGKTLLVTLEQGMGDAIHYIRFVESISTVGARVVVECVPALADLLSTAPGVALVVAPGTAVPEASYYAPLMSLPHLLGTTLDTIPARMPYFAVPVGIVTPHWRARICA